mmetsp:Transcript_90695/g.141543  ORF Transcript_90695/g.141543 Transcript_90695/m.141543 type:complete len:550 (+) Transcript_90695:41-1690(+)
MEEPLLQDAPTSQCAKRYLPVAQRELVIQVFGVYVAILAAGGVLQIQQESQRLLADAGLFGHACRGEVIPCIVQEDLLHSAHDVGRGVACFSMILQGLWYDIRGPARTGAEGASLVFIGQLLLASALLGAPTHDGFLCWLAFPAFLLTHFGSMLSVWSVVGLRWLWPDREGLMLGLAVSAWQVSRCGSYAPSAIASFMALAGFRSASSLGLAILAFCAASALAASFLLKLLPENAQLKSVHASALEAQTVALQVETFSTKSDGESYVVDIDTHINASRQSITSERASQKLASMDIWDFGRHELLPPEVTGHLPSSAWSEKNFQLSAMGPSSYTPRDTRVMNVDSMNGAMHGPRQHYQGSAPLWRPCDGSLTLDERLEECDSATVADEAMSHPSTPVRSHSATSSLRGLQVLDETQGLPTLDNTCAIPIDLGPPDHANTCPEEWLKLRPSSLLLTSTEWKTCLDRAVPIPDLERIHSVTSIDSGLEDVGEEIQTKSWQQQLWRASTDALPARQCQSASRGKLSVERLIDARQGARWTTTFPAMEQPVHIF